MLLVIIVVQVVKNQQNASNFSVLLWKLKVE